MDKPSRRDLLKQLGTAGVSAALATPLAAGAQPEAAGAGPDLATAVVPLERWSFALDPEALGESQGWFKSAKEGPTEPYRQVDGPAHLADVGGKRGLHGGVGGIGRNLMHPAHWADCWVRIEFEAVFHTAKVWLNGTYASGEIIHADGYTAFTFDVSPALRFNRRNFLAVKVENSFRGDMLPRNNSYDWAQDGGITRPVSLLVAPSAYIDLLRVDAVPDLDTGNAPVKIRAKVRNGGKRRGN